MAAAGRGHPRLDLPRPPRRPTIEVKRGYIARTIDEAEDALLASGLPIFERARMLVHPIVSTLPAADDLKTDVVTFKAMQPENIIYMLNKHAATFTQYDGRKKKMVVIDPPLEVAKGLLAKGQWTFPTVTGVITVPTMRPDGTILDRLRVTTRRPSSGTRLTGIWL